MKIKWPYYRRKFENRTNFYGVFQEIKKALCGDYVIPSVQT